MTTQDATLHKQATELAKALRMAGSERRLPAELAGLAETMRSWVEVWGGRPLQYLGTYDVLPSAAVFAAAGVDPATHTIITWHDPAWIAAARDEGRLVAEFRVRAGDALCYVARREAVTA